MTMTIQEELLALRDQVAHLKLRRAGAESSQAPFPITLSAAVEPPPGEAERYDVSSLPLVVTLGPGVASAVVAASGGSLQQHVAAAVDIEVGGTELTHQLRSAIAKELHEAWLAGEPVPGRLQLASIWRIAEARFPALLSLLPELLEAYQGEDAAGHTVRRYAIIYLPTVQQAQEHGEQQEPLAALEASRQDPPQGGLQAHQQPVQPPAVPAGQQGMSVGLELHLPQLPPALARELAAVRRRYASGFQLHQMAPPAPASPEATAAAIANLQLSTSDRQQPPAQADAVVCCSVRVQPTDPAWDKAAVLTLYCTLSSGGSRSRPSPAPDTPASHAAVTGIGLSNRQAAAPLRVTVSVQRPAWCQQEEEGEDKQDARWQQQRRQQMGLQLTPLEAEVLDRLLAAASEPVSASSAAGPGRAGRARPVQGPQSSSALLSVLRYAENHAGSLLQQAREVTAEVAARRTAAAAKAASSAAVPRQQRLGKCSAGSTDGSSQFSDDGAGAGGYYSTSGGGSDSESDREQSYSEEEPEAEGSAGGAGHSEAVLAGGAALTLDGLQLVECDALELLKLMLQVKCTRCGQLGDLAFATDAVALGSSNAQRGGQLAAQADCSGCHQAWEVVVAPKLVHEHSNTLAHVRCQGCQPADLLPSLLAGQCSRCAFPSAFRAAAVGRWNERACGRCHTLMQFHFTSALFLPLAVPGQRAQLGSQQEQQGQLRMRRQPRSGDGAPPSGAAAHAVLQPGQPLPDNGTCKHYRHSYRWLRFPCCGRRWACDLCHEEGTEDGHEMKWATRMVCGFCSTEQPLDSRCKHCGKKLAASSSAPSGRQTRFWEGGHGQRDPRKLDKRDPHRYRSRMKTRSRKSTRVGEEGKARRERREQTR